jgi:hypothetical protein
MCFIHSQAAFASMPTRTAPNKKSLPKRPGRDGEVLNLRNKTQLTQLNRLGNLFANIEAKSGDKYGQPD